MESARSRAQPRRPARGAQPRSRPRAVPRAGAAAVRINWDRVGRVALLLSLVVVAGLYIEPLASWVQAWQDSGRERVAVQRLERENATLLARRRALDDPRVLAAEARRLGMVLPGEVPYVVTGLPGRSPEP